MKSYLLYFKNDEGSVELRDCTSLKLEASRYRVNVNGAGIIFNNPIYMVNELKHEMGGLKFLPVLMDRDVNGETVIL